ncbi:MAG TPA: ABC transporter ATP-binding protein [Thermoplasmata archaeon]|nr:ABC transporter ATP-binding protein [Thermoplasmata archaeon]
MNGVLAVEVEHLSASYGERPALRDVSLSFRSGEFLALTGPNGSGKTTFLKALLGLVPAAGGRIRIGGEPTEARRVRWRAQHLAWVPQVETPLDNVPLSDYVLYGRFPHIGWLGGEGPDDVARAQEALRAVDLADRGGSGILELSGGERQRALLARALAQDTPILLLDEPTASLDIGHQLDLLERIRRLAHERGRCVVAAMHDLNLAARYADRIAVLSHGRRVALGTPPEVLSPELLRSVWGVSAELRSDPRTGLPFLIPRLPAPDRAERGRSAGARGPVHVVAGGGSATELFPRLLDEGYDVTAGVLPLFDSDSETAERLHVPFAAEVPFAPLGAEARAANRRLLAEADVVVVAPVHVGPANLGNLEDVASTVAEAARIYLFVQPPWARRDFADGRAEAIANRLLSSGAQAVMGVDELIARLATRRSGPTRNHASAIRGAAAG